MLSPLSFLINSASFQEPCFELLCYCCLTVILISYCVCSRQYDIWLPLLYIILVFKAFRHLFQHIKQQLICCFCGNCGRKKRVGLVALSLKAYTKNLSYTPLRSSGAGKFPLLTDADKDEIQNKYIRQLHTSIYSSNTTSLIGLLKSNHSGSVEFGSWLLQFGI